MPDPPPFQTTITSLTDTAERCRRLAAAITDGQTCERLLQLAKECEEKAAELQKQTLGKKPAASKTRFAKAPAAVRRGTDAVSSTNK